MRALARSGARRLTGSLWLQATGVLIIAYVAILPLGVVAVGRLRTDQAIGDRSRSEVRLAADSQGLRLAVARQAAAVRVYFLTGDRAALDEYQRGGAQAAGAWSAAESDAAAASLRGALPPVRAAMDAWQGWAAGRLSGTAGAAALPAGDRLLAAFQTAAARLADRAAAAARADEARATGVDQLVVRDRVLGPVLGNAVVLIVAAIVVTVTLRPVSRLAELATRLAGGGRPAVPYTDRHTQVGALARALTRWESAEASRRAMFEHTPVGVFTMRPDLLVVDANPAMLAMFGVHREVASPVVFDAFVHQDDLESCRAALTGLAASGDDLKLEKRFVGRDGRVFWGSVTVAVVRRGDGSPSYYVGMLTDISEHRERLERAAQVQRDLLPDAAPVLAGYDLAGVCRPSREMGGDFYDWQRRGPGSLTLTLGDVMGKDMPAALLMATVAAALRASAAQASVADAVESVAASTERDLERAGAFVTLFHGWLDPGSGTLRYVDAGHGLLAVVGREGVRRPPRARSLPLGVLAGERYPESTLTLAPGESLVVFSDGVLDVHPELEERPDAVAGLLAGARSAAEMAERLVTGPGSAHDDLTTLVLCRSA